MVTHRYNSGSIDPTTGFHYNFLDVAVAAGVPLHSHGYYEMFLITDGTVGHQINENNQELTEGAFFFIRPRDMHRFYRVGNANGHFINVEFAPKALDALRLYLQEGPQFEALLSQPMAPCARIDSIGKDLLQSYLEELNLLSSTDARERALHLRMVLVFAFSRHFLRSKKIINEAMPDWLASTCAAMAQRDNFACGVKRMVEISCKSPEHLSRVMRKSTGKAPSEFVNELRLNYAANLLRHSSAKISWIAQQSGFGDMSHFHCCFRELFGVTPAGFRKT